MFTNGHRVHYFLGNEFKLPLFYEGQTLMFTVLIRREGLTIAALKEESTRLFLRDEYVQGQLSDNHERQVNCEQYPETQIYAHAYANANKRGPKYRKRECNCPSYKSR